MRKQFVILPLFIHYISFKDAIFSHEVIYCLLFDEGLFAKFNPLRFSKAPFPLLTKGTTFLFELFDFLLPQ